MESEKAGGYSSKCPGYNMNGRCNTFKFFARETEIKKRTATLKNLWIEEFNNFQLLKIIPDRENKSSSMQNVWAWGGC